MTAPKTAGSREIFTVKLVDSEELVAGLPIKAGWAFTSPIDIKNGFNAFHGGPLRRVLHIASGLFLQPITRSMGEASAIVDHVESLPIDWSSPIDELLQACQRNAVDWDEVMRTIRPPTPKRADVPAATWLLKQPEWEGAKIIGEEPRQIGRLVEGRSALGRKIITWDYQEEMCFIIEHPSGARAVISKKAKADALAGRI